MFVTFGELSINRTKLNIIKISNAIYKLQMTTSCLPKEGFIYRLLISPENFKVSDNVAKSHQSEEVVLD